MAKNIHLIKLYLTLLFTSLINTSIIASNPEISTVSNHQHHKDNHPKTDAEIGVYELKKGNISVKLTNYGATVISVFLPDKHGKMADVVLGYDTAKDYVNDTTYFGAIVGRVANRIAGAKYTYKGKQYKLVPNEGKNILHGGPKGYSRVIWKVHQYSPEASSPHISFDYFSRDGEEGFPGDVKVRVTYEIVDGGHLLVKMKAKALNKATPISLAQHTYWNLRGHNSGDILDHEVQIFGSHITPVDDNLIPTGKIEKVQGTPYDFLKPHSVESQLKDLPKGFDINYVLDVDKNHRSKTPVAIVKDKESGRVLELWSDKPGVQFYTSNMLKNMPGKGGYVYKTHAALCLETQGFPDSVNHPNFPSVMVAPGETYKHHMYFRFSTVN